MVRETSRIAYESIMASGLLGKRQKHAYKVLSEQGPMTGNELSQAMGMQGQWKRCSELKKRGLAIEVGERLCKVTGHLAYLWEAVDTEPIAPPKAKGKMREKIEKAVQDERQECAAIAFGTDDLIGRIIGEKILERGITP